MRKLTIEEMQRIATERGGKCLSDTYINQKTKLLWQCAQGHQWKATPDSVKSGKWCPYCGGTAKLTIEEMQRIAAERGGKCLSSTYVNNRTKLVWECVEGHQWEATPGSVKSGKWCPYCAGNTKLIIAEMQQIAAKHGGKCLSTTYTNSSTKLLWECTEGHQWETAPGHIKGGHWCPHCAGLAKGTIEEMQEIADNRGGKCLSNTYINSQTKLLWECENGHRWEAAPAMVKSGHWCPKCYNRRRGDTRRLTIEKMQQIAKERGGKCLSDTYVNTRTKLLWQCMKGHQWKATPPHVKQGDWCPHCAGVAKGTLEDMQQIAEERGGKCLSNTYINKRTKLLWECSEGHQWKTTPHEVKSGCWCPECSSRLGERICRAFFEQLFEKKFPRSYPKWLVNQNGNRMELDGYCKSLGVAFEHHGEQHYSTRTHFITTKEELQERQKTDKLKRALCKQHGVILVEIPEIPTRLSIEEVKSFIKQQCKQHGIPLPVNFDEKLIDLKKAYATSNSAKIFEELQTIAKERGGKCLSDTYVDSKTKLLWQCAEGHQWEASSGGIKNNGRWCPYCSGRKGTLQEMQEIARERGGKCLSEVYIDNDTKLLWECAEGHQWEATPSNIKKGTWCPYCVIQTRKGTIEELQEIAKERGGKCLSKTYVDSKTKLVWECAKGHQWEATPNGIKRGSWCPYCVGAMKGNLEEMQKLAKEHGGKCLSNVYTNRRTKLLWECKEGHQWKTAPGNIKSGNWCPYCGIKRRVEARKLGIEVMRQIAEERGGRCLSTTYINSKTKLLWECDEGHRWKATPGSVRSGKWCPYCGGTAKLTIEEMRQIAKEHRGKCLSNVYVNDRTKLLWQCERGHQWEARPHDVKRGAWCPTCARLKKRTKK